MRLSVSVSVSVSVRVSVRVRVRVRVRARVRVRVRVRARVRVKARVRVRVRLHLARDRLRRHELLHVEEGGARPLGAGALDEPRLAREEDALQRLRVARVEHRRL